MKVTPTEKVVDFAQSEFKTKQFRHDQPVSHVLKEMLEEIHKEFTEHVVERYFDDVQSFLKEFIDDHHPRDEKRQALENNLFWWKIFYESSQEIEWSPVEDFIYENFLRFRDKPLITSWLREWDKVIPKFYYIGYKYSDRVFFVIDVLEEKMFDVILSGQAAVSPEQGEFALGMLIPIGDSLYSPIVDFYRFDYRAREAIGVNIKPYFNKLLKTSSMNEAFVHVLSATLQIERKIFMKNQANKASN